MPHDQNSPLSEDDKFAELQIRYTKKLNSFNEKSKQSAATVDLSAEYKELLKLRAEYDKANDKFRERSSAAHSSFAAPAAMQSTHSTTASGTPTKAVRPRSENVSTAKPRR